MSHEVGVLLAVEPVMMIQPTLEQGNGDLEAKASALPAAVLQCTGQWHSPSLLTTVEM
jgi:hypothetical protein